MLEEEVRAIHDNEHDEGVEHSSDREDEPMALDTLNDAAYLKGIKVS